MYLNPEPAEKLVFDVLWARGLPLTVKRFEDPRPRRSSDSAGQLWAVRVGFRPKVTGTQVAQSVPTFVEVKLLQCATWGDEAMLGGNYAPAGWWINCQWDFADAVDGLLAAMRWDPETEPEPQGWVTCGKRSRPGGVALDEFVMDSRLHQDRWPALSSQSLLRSIRSIR